MAMIAGVGVLPLLLPHGDHHVFGYPWAVAT